MSDIINFRRPGAVSTPEGGVTRDGFSVTDLVDGAMSFDTLSDGSAATSDVIPAFSKAQELQRIGRDDWSNQELASLYRINRLLNMADLTIETDRGVTDEGDPWFVFLDSKGDVFVHLCRIGHTYMFDSPAQEQVVTSYSLNDLVAAFTEQSELTQAEQRENQSNVVRLVGHRNTKVVVHPGAALAALIWSVYISSDDYTAPLLAPSVAEDSPAVASEDDAAEAQVLSDTEVLEGAAHLVAIKGGAEVPLSVMLNACAAAETRGDMKGFGYSGTLNTVGVGLSALALTCGMDLWFDKATLAAGTLEGNSEETPVADAAPELEDVAPVDLQDLTWDALQSIHDFAANLLMPDTDETAADTFAANLNGAAETLQTMLSLFPKEVSGDIAVLADVALDPGFEVAHFDDEAIAQLSEAADAEPVQDTPQNAQIALSDLLMAYAATAQHNTTILPENMAAWLEDTTGAASRGVLLQEADRNFFEKFGNLSITLDQFESADTLELQYDLFDDGARAYINFLLQKNDAVQVVSYSSEVVFFDKTAFEGTNTQAYAKSWSFEDGGVISTIGLKSDLEMFDLIA